MPFRGRTLEKSLMQQELGAGKSHVLEVTQEFKYAAGEPRKIKSFSPAVSLQHFLLQWQLVRDKYLKAQIHFHKIGQKVEFGAKRR